MKTKLLARASVAAALAVTGLLAFTAAPAKADVYSGIVRDTTCANWSTDWEFLSDGAWVCFEITGGDGSYADINLYDVTEIQNQSDYYIYLDWTDCNGGTHLTFAGPGWFSDAGDAPGEYGGCTYMADVTKIGVQ
jgi:hypothetical protein